MPKSNNTKSSKSTKIPKTETKSGKPAKTQNLKLAEKIEAIEPETIEIEPEIVLPQKPIEIVGKIGKIEKIEVMEKLENAEQMENIEQNMRMPNLWRRMFARILDFFVLAILPAAVLTQILLTYMIPEEKQNCVSLIRLDENATNQTFKSLLENCKVDSQTLMIGVISTISLSLVFCFLLGLWQLHRRGQTWGQKKLQIQVVGKTSLKLSWIQVLMHEIVILIFVLSVLFNQIAILWLWNVDILGSFFILVFVFDTIYLNFADQTLHEKLSETKTVLRG